MISFEKMVKANIERKGQEATIWKTAQDVMDWWIYETKQDPDQELLFNDDLEGIV